MKKRSELRYMAIAQDIENRIKRGDIKDKLPTQRTLISEYRTSIRTIQEVFAALKARGIIRTSPGVGSFVTANDNPMFIPTQR